MTVSSAADQFQLDIGQRLVFCFRHDKCCKHGTEQTKHAERQKANGRAETTRKLIGHERSHKH